MAAVEATSLDTGAVAVAAADGDLAPDDSRGKAELASGEDLGIEFVVRVRGVPRWKRSSRGSGMRWSAWSTR